MEWLKRMRARLTGRIYAAPEIVARQVERSERDIPSCTLTTRYSDCWEYGCLREPGCQYRTAPEAERYRSTASKAEGA